MPTEKQFRTSLFLLQIILGISTLITTYTALRAVVDLSKLSWVIQQFSKLGKVGNFDAIALRGFLLLFLYGFLQLLVGFLVRIRKARFLCAVIFAIEWTYWPLGTILGSAGLYWVTRDWNAQKAEAAT